MPRLLRRQAGRAAFVGLVTILTASGADAAGVPIIVDTDISSDVDDVGALALMHALADNGEAAILGVVVNTRNPVSAACVDVINTGARWVRCAFPETEPNRAWVTDVTAIATDEEWLYLAVMRDLFSRRVVGWATSSCNDTVLALEALQTA